jgi:DNA polymerase I-like protein with 3'-5' exonuclease and polymerase domains
MFDIATMDTETTGLDIYHGCRPFVVTACTGKHNYLWKGQVDPQTREVHWGKSEIYDLYRFICSCKQIVFHNRNFDVRMIAALGIPLIPGAIRNLTKSPLIPNTFPILHDTLIASHVICSGSRKVGHPHGLKELMVKYFGYDNSDEDYLQEKIVSARQGIQNIAIAKVGHPHFPAATDTAWEQDMWLEIGACIYYGVKDVERTYILHKALQTRIFELGLQSQYTMRMRLLNVLYNMQTVGINIYIDKAQRIVNELTIQIPRLVELMRTEAGIPWGFDPASRKDLTYFLYTALQLPVINTTDTGQPATDDKTLNIFEDEFRHITAIRYLRNWRKATKQRTDISTYIKWSQHNPKRPLHFKDDSNCPTIPFDKVPTRRITLHESPSGTLDLPYLPPEIQDDGLFQLNKIHSTIHLTGTKWTRNSSSDPNQQNFNKKLKFLFGPLPGYFWLYCDVVNIELRIWAYEVGAKSLIEAFESGQSVHMIIAHALYSDLIEKLGEQAFKDTKSYTRCKSGTFARIYGGGVKKVNDTYGIDNACDIIDEKCPEIGAYFQSLNGTLEYNAEKFDYPCIFTIQGYKLDVPVTAPHSVPSARIQGTAGLIVQDMMIEVAKHERYKNPLQIPIQTPDQLFGTPTSAQLDIYYETLGIPDTLRCQMTQQVHDSLCFEIPNHANRDETCKILINFMEKIAERTIPTCPLDYDIIDCHQDEEPYFKDYLYIPEKYRDFELEMLIHNHQYLCIGTYSKDYVIKKYGKTRQEAMDAVISEIDDVPF